MSSIPTESGIRDTVMRVLKATPECWAFVKHQTGRGVRGIPDVIGAVSGIPLALEIKRPRDVRFRPGQLLQLEKAAEAGCVAAVLTSRKDAEDLIAAIQAVPPHGLTLRTQWDIWFARAGLRHLQPPPVRPVS